MSRSKVFLMLGFLLAIVASPADSEAAKKSPKDKKVSEKSGSQKFSESFSVQGKKKAFFCAGPFKARYLPGDMMKNGKFLSYSKRLANIKKMMKEADSKKLKKLEKKQKKYKKLNKEAKALCKNKPAIPPENNQSNNGVNLLEVKTNATEWDLYHLYEKAALGAVPDDVKQAFAQGGISAAVDAMMTVKPATEVEVEARKLLDHVDDPKKEEGPVNHSGIQAAILYRLAATPNPFFERHAYIFLHNLLATSSVVLTQQKQPELFEDHLNLIRAHAITGDYKALVKEMAHDPAMLRWLTGYINIAQEPNEDFGRELMELFTLGAVNPITGVPNYTELDVARVARLTAGWSILLLPIGKNQTAWGRIRRDLNVEREPVTVFEGTPCERTFSYDSETKNPQDINFIEHLFSCRAVDVSQFLGYRLAMEYVNPEPSPELIEALASELRKNDFNINTTLKTLFKSAYFYSEHSRNRIITMPADRLISLIRRVGLPVSTVTFVGGDSSLRGRLANAGHILSQPRTVFGWNHEEFANSQWQLKVLEAASAILNNSNYRPSSKDLDEVPAFRYSYILPAGDIETMTADDLIRHFQRIMNIENMTDAAWEKIRDYMNQVKVAKGRTPEFNVRNISHVSDKVPGLIYILFSLPENFVR